MGLRDHILAADDRKSEPLYIEEWDATILVREIGLQDALAFAGKQDGSKLVVEAQEIASVIVSGVLNPETHEPLFTKDDIPALLDKSRNVLMRLYMQILGLSGSVEDARKN